jgi:hypothetical protein
VTHSVRLQAVFFLRLRAQPDAFTYDERMPASFTKLTLSRLHHLEFITGRVLPFGAKLGGFF